MQRMRLLIIGGCLACGLGATYAADPAPHFKTENVIWVVSDGLRWQEVFAGADETLMTKESGGVPDVEALRKDFWRETPEARREALLPFVWSEIAKRGQLYGNSPKGSVARVTNGLNFSYPGYSEMVCGFVDPKVDSNDKRNNPNVSVLEWLNGRPAFAKRVAAVCAWDAFPFILNAERSGMPVNAGIEPLAGKELSPELTLLNRLMLETPPIDDTVRYDSFTFYAALDYVKRHNPRVFFLGLGETDEYAHHVRYDRYLQSAHRADAYVRRLWETLQAMPEYRDRTTLIFLADHGRGATVADWKKHGKAVEGSDAIWLAVLGPDTPALGERTQVPDVTLNQVAATVAALLGEDYVAAVPQAGRPIAEVLGSPRR